MKIKFNCLLDNFLNNKEKAISSQKAEEKSRNGYVKEEKFVHTKQQGVKVLTSMVLLLALSVSLGFRTGEFNIPTKKDDEKIYAKTLDSVAVFSSVDDVYKSIPVFAEYEELLVFSKPLEGQIQKMYSKDKVIYSKTLKKWKTHDGIDISAKSGSLVLAMEKGEVVDVYDDSLLGKTIVISHIAGYTSRYSNLDENVFVSVGDKVVKGQRIGRVGNTAKSEIEDEPHLHLSVYLGDNSIDPTYIFQ